MYASCFDRSNIHMTVNKTEWNWISVHFRYKKLYEKAKDDPRGTNHLVNVCHF
jgi:hypothetical protein